MKTKSILTLMMAMILLFISACGATEEPKQEGEKATEKDTLEGTEITLMVPDWGVPPEDMLNQFTEETGISVVVNAVAWDEIKDKVSVAAVGKTAPADVVEVDWSWLGEFAAAGWLEPLDISEETISDIPTLQSYTYDGQKLAVPYFNDFRLAFMNTKHFEAAGITETPASWDDVISASKTIKEKGITQYPISIPVGAEENTTTTFLWLTLSRNGVVFNDDNTLNKEATMDTLNLIQKLVIEEKLVDPANVAGTGFDAYNRIASGEASYMIGPTSFVTSVNDEAQSKVVGDIKSVLIPGTKGPAKQTVSFTEAVGVAKYSKNKEAAQEFVKWLSSNKTQVELNEKINTMPTRTSVLESLVKEGKFGDAGAFLEQSKLVKSPFPNGVPSYYTEMSTVIFNTINSMALGNITPEEAFEQMNAKVSELAAQK